MRQSHPVGPALRVYHLADVASRRVAASSPSSDRPLAAAAADVSSPSPPSPSSPHSLHALHHTHSKSLDPPPRLSEELVASVRHLRHAQSWTERSLNARGVLSPSANHVRAAASFDAALRRCVAEHIDAQSHWSGISVALINPRSPTAGDPGDTALPTVGSTAFTVAERLEKRLSKVIESGPRSVRLEQTRRGSAAYGGELRRGSSAIAGQLRRVSMAQPGRSRRVSMAQAGQSRSVSMAQPGQPRRASMAQPGQSRRGSTVQAGVSS